MNPPMIELCDVNTDQRRVQARRTGHLGRCGRPVLSLLAAFAVALAVPHSAFAQFTANPYVDAHYEHDSNVFRVPNSQANLVAFGDPTLADNDQKYVAGADATYLWGEQKLTATVEGRRFEFDHYSDLDHNEYLGDVALKWKLTSLLDGTLEARQEQSMAPFTLGNSTQLTIDVDRKIDALLNLNFNPDWRLETGVYSHNLKSPLQSFPDFVERETGTHLALLNRSVTNLSYGFAVDHIAGRYENAPDVGPYSQTTAALTLNYTVSALTSLDAAAGYTKRTQGTNVDSISGFTGSLGYTRQLTAKTSFTVHLVRAVNSYVAAGASEIDTSATAGLTWQATYRIGATVNYGYVRSSFVGQIIPGSDANGRVDTSPVESLNINYQVLRRLKLHAYLNKQSRSSNVELYNFSDSVVGLEARFSWR